MLPDMMNVVYKITYPNGKIYIGKDFKSADTELIARDFRGERHTNFNVGREILWQSETATDAEVSAMEVELIRASEANNPAIGYNRWPTFKP
jgi:outer membrane protein assembly factor BamB